MEQIACDGLSTATATVPSGCRLSADSGAALPACHCCSIFPTSTSQFGNIPPQPLKLTHLDGNLLSLVAPPEHTAEGPPRQQGPEFQAVHEGGSERPLPGCVERLRQ